jgi:uncharacterized protein YndB with AHSA1/START domain
VYRALLDPEAIAKWRVPTGMTSEVHAFEAREGGAFRVSLTYEEETGTGKTTSHTDTYHGRFAELVPDERIVELIEFESDDPAMQGEMTIITELVDAPGTTGPGSGTELRAVHHALPPGVSPELNEVGWRDSMAKLASYVEARENGTT